MLRLPEPGRVLHCSLVRISGSQQRNNPVPDSELLLGMAAEEALMITCIGYVAAHSTPRGRAGVPNPPGENICLFSQN